MPTCESFATRTLLPSYALANIMDVHSSVRNEIPFSLFAFSA
jgi:hypothetical protein